MNESANITPATQEAHPKAWRKAGAGAAMGGIGGFAISTLYETTSHCIKDKKVEIPRFSYLISSSVATVFVSASFFAIKAYREASKANQTANCSIER